MLDRERDQIWSNLLQREAERVRGGHEHWQKWDVADLIREIAEQGPDHERDETWRSLLREKAMELRRSPKPLAQRSASLLEELARQTPHSGYTRDEIWRRWLQQRAADVQRGHEHWSKWGVADVLIWHAEHEPNPED